MLYYSMKKTVKLCKKYTKFLVFVGLIILYIIYTFTKKEMFENKNIVLVVARYNEDLEWLKNEPFNKYDVIVYNKGDNDNFYKSPKIRSIINLENVGVCVHTYLYHIIHHYDNLDNITVFLPGSCMDEIGPNEKTYMKKKQTLQTMQKMEETNNSAFVIHVHTDQPIDKEFYHFTITNYPMNNLQNIEKNSDDYLRLCDIRPFGKWFQHVFKDIEIHDLGYKGIFALTREHIRNRSNASYIDLISYVDKDKNEESAHYFERSFLAVFHPIPENCLINY